MKAGSVGELGRSPLHLLHRAYQSAQEIFNAEMTINDLTPRQLTVLMAIADADVIGQSAISHSTGIDRSTVGNIVHRLRRKGLLRRRSMRHGTSFYTVSLTDEGRRVVLAAEPLASRIDQRVLNSLPPSQREQFIACLQAIIAVLQATRLDEGES